MKISEPKDSLTKSTRAPVSLLATFLLFAALLSSTFTFAQEQSDPRWVTTWSTSPSTLPGEDDPDNNAQEQTLRLIVHSSVGGDSVRIRLSNAHGNEALKIGAASIALQSEGSSIQPGTSKSLQFAGQSSVSIPKGAVVFSDPLNYDLPQMTNLSVSLYLPQDNGFLTAHALSNQTNYMSDGSDQTNSVNLADQTETAAWSLLTAIDVINTNAISAIAVVGDSITDGWGSTTSANQR